MHLLAVAILFFTGLIGIALTLLTLPGIWLVIAVALLCQLWQPGLFPWWILGAVVALGLLAELLEFIASMAGAAKAGGTRHGALWSIVGGLIGAILGTPIAPIIGTIIGGALGAGIGAMLGEIRGSKMPWRNAALVGRGAATGRLLSIAIKAGVCVIIIGMLLIATIVR